MVTREEGQSVAKTMVVALTISMLEKAYREDHDGWAAGHDTGGQPQVGGGDG